jgi:chromosome partitioning protein
MADDCASGRPSLRVGTGSGGIDKEAAATLTGQGASIATHQLTQRAAFAHSVIDGRTAQEFEPTGKAAAEIEAIYKWLCGTVDMPINPHDRKAA